MKSSKFKATMQSFKIMALIQHKQCCCQYILFIEASLILNFGEEEQVLFCGHWIKQYQMVCLSENDTKWT